MKNMDDYFNELRISMKGATPKEATDRLIQEVNAEWGEQCKKSWLPEYTEEVLRFIKDAEDRYHVKGFRITDPSVGHECMRDNMDCIKYLDVSLLTPEYLDTLIERNEYKIMVPLKTRAKEESGFEEKVFTDSFKEKYINPYLPDPKTTLPTIKEAENDYDAAKELLSKRPDAYNGMQRKYKIDPKYAELTLLGHLGHKIIFSHIVENITMEAKENLDFASKAYVAISRGSDNMEKEGLLKHGFNALYKYAYLPKKVIYDPEFWLKVIEQEPKLFTDALSTCNSVGNAVVNEQFVYDAYKTNPNVLGIFSSYYVDMLLNYIKETGKNEPLDIILKRKAITDERISKLNAANSDETRDELRKTFEEEDLTSFESIDDSSIEDPVDIVVRGTNPDSLESLSPHSVYS